MEHKGYLHADGRISQNDADAAINELGYFEKSRTWVARRLGPDGQRDVTHRRLERATRRDVVAAACRRSDHVVTYAPTGC